MNLNEGSPAFEATAYELELRSGMTRLEARGTLRLALKEAGLLPKTTGARPMLAVVDKILPAMLAVRRVAHVADVCRALGALVRALPAWEAPEADAPEHVFARMAGPGSMWMGRAGQRL